MKLICRKRERHMMASKSNGYDLMVRTRFYLTPNAIIDCLKCLADRGSNPSYGSMYPWFVVHVTISIHGRTICPQNAWFHAAFRCMSYMTCTIHSHAARGIHTWSRGRNTSSPEIHCTIPQPGSPPEKNFNA